MFRVFVYVLCWMGTHGMTVRSARMSYVSPDGANKMLLERSQTGDLDSSATGFIYSSDGLGPATLRHLNSPEVVQMFKYEPGLTNQEYQQEEEEGTQGTAGYYTDIGKQGQTGYDGFDAYQKGILSKYNQNQDTGFYNNAAGHKKVADDVSAHYGSSNAKANGEKSAKSGEVNTSKKGHKTTGFHKVYHKDEYKKEHSFYDESDQSGYSGKHERDEKSYDLANGGFQKGARADSAFQVNSEGNKGFYDKGKFAEQDEGFKGAKLGEKFFRTESESGRKADDEFRKRFRFGGD